MNNKDYSNLPLEELQQKEKQLKKNETFSSYAIGFLIGVMLFGIAKGGFGFVYVVIPLFLIAATARNSQTIKKDREAVQAEIERKGK